MRVQVPLIATGLALLAFNAMASVPLSTAGEGHLTVPTYINASGPFPFVLDTGADESGVYEWFAKMEKLPAGKTQELVGMTGTSRAPTFHVAKLSIDGRAIHNFIADGYPNRHDHGRQAGVGGNDLMNGTVAVFDFLCRTVEVHPKPFLIQSILTRGAVEVRGGAVRDGTQLTLPVWIKGVKGVAVLDTGSKDTKINLRFAAAAGVNASSSSFRNADLLYGADSNAVKSRKGPVENIQFGGVRISSAEVRVVNLPVFESFGLGDGPAMILGIDLMRSSRLIYDHEKGIFWFDRSSCHI